MFRPRLCIQQTDSGRDSVSSLSIASGAPGHLGPGAADGDHPARVTPTCCKLLVPFTIARGFVGRCFETR